MPRISRVGDLEFDFSNNLTDKPHQRFMGVSAPMFLNFRITLDSPLVMHHAQERGLGLSIAHDEDVKSWKHADECWLFEQREQFYKHWEWSKKSGIAEEIRIAIASIAIKLSLDACISYRCINGCNDIFVVVGNLSEPIRLPTRFLEALAKHCSTNVKLCCREKVEV